jgi:O-methyltransferase involved in polyketide biosynthesis
MQPNQLSNTAAFIAVKFYGLTREEPYRSLFDEEAILFYERLVKNMPAPLRYYHCGLKSETLSKFFIFWEELLLPGDLMHIILRKYYLTNWVKELGEQGYRQMLVLGAGFDHLGALNASKDMRCVELDMPKMISLKKDFIIKHGYEHPNLLLKEAFFTRDTLLEILQAQSTLNPNRKTMVVAEGFFDYFNQTTSSEILTDAAAFFSDDVTLLSTLFSLQELSGFRSSVYKNSIKLAGEKLKLHLDKSGYIKLLKQHRFSIERSLSFDEMKQEVLKPRGISLPVLPGFYLVRANRLKME